MHLNEKLWEDKVCLCYFSLYSVSGGVGSFPCAGLERARAVQVVGGPGIFRHSAHEGASLSALRTGRCYS